MADVLEIRGESPFKINAYRKASRLLASLDIPVESFWQNHRLEELPGIGPAISKKIDEFLQTGRMGKYQEVIASVPHGLVDILRIRNIGPRTLARLHRELGVEKLEDLKRTIEDGRLSRMSGFGRAKTETLRKEIEFFERESGRLPLGTAMSMADEAIAFLRTVRCADRIHPAGSLRRCCETVGDIDILAETDNPDKAIGHFTAMPGKTEVLNTGDVKASIRYGIVQIDLQTVSHDSWGAALQHFTGSQGHNIRLRRLAKSRGWTLNENGLFQDSQRLAGVREEDIYESLGMPWIAPELREDRGEIERALESRLPDLVDLGDITGDFHVHTRWSDGIGTIQDMAEKARRLGYSFLAICDHSRSVSYAGGLGTEALMRQIEEIEGLNKGMSDFRILSGIEVDILSDGSLDFEDDILRRLGVVIASVHTGFKSRVTERMIRAVGNPYVNILAHPTGRILTQREGYDVDISAVIRACAESGTALELNANAERLDLGDVLCRQASDQGVPLAIGTDAHRPEQMAWMGLGVGTARRAWLERKDVINGWSLDRILSWRDEKRRKRKTS